MRSSGVMAPVVGGPTNLSGSVAGTSVDGAARLSGAARRVSCASAEVEATSVQVAARTASTRMAAVLIERVANVELSWTLLGRKLAGIGRCCVVAEGVRRATPDQSQWSVPTIVTGNSGPVHDAARAL